MRYALRHIVPTYWRTKALVLMYHRVADTRANIWDITVRPSHFEEQLQVIQEVGHVVPLQELTDALRNKRIKKNSIAITFDDGYVDNYTIAKPLLEKYAMPATFFIASAYTDTATPFWWDELEQLILYTPSLPPSLSITIGNQQLEFLLHEETLLTDSLHKTNQSWKACDEAPPTVRCSIYYRIWEQLKLVSHELQQQHLQDIRQWANAEKTYEPHDLPMSSAQLLDLSSKNLFDLGAHTVTHLSLANSPKQLQQQEMMDNKVYLENITAKEVTMLSYPYGNYNPDTIAAAKDTNFKAAFTTEERAVTQNSASYTLARCQVKDWNREEFRKHLRNWLS